MVDDIRPGKHRKPGLFSWFNSRADERVQRAVDAAIEPAHQIECTLCHDTALVQSDAGELAWLIQHLDKHPGYRLWETGPLAFYEDPSPDEEAAIARAKAVSDVDQ